MHQKCHFIGIGGIGMSGLAKILLGKKYDVSGSDLSINERINELIAGGAKVTLEHSAANLPNDSIVIYTSMVNEQNIEYNSAKQRNLPLLHRSDVLNALMMGSQPLLVSGSHGKTTTSSLLAWVLENAGLDPTYAVGGVLLNTSTNARYGKGSFFIAEADESDGTFTKYQGFGGIVTNISLEHMDFYKTKEALLGSFKAFCQKVQNKECFFWCKEDSLLQSISPEGISYGFVQGADLQGSNLRQQRGEVIFDVSFRGNFYPDITLPLMGQHNALNALAVFGLCLSLNIEEEKIRAAFKLFKGVARRMERKGEEKGVLVIDDYAHHPKEINTTIKTLRQSFPWRRIVVVYQPHRYSRTLHCKGTFGSIFNDADKVLITDIYAAHESPIEGVTVKSIIDEVQNQGHNNCHYVHKASLIQEVVKHLQPLDVVVLLGAGDISSYAYKLLTEIKNKLSPLKLGVIFGGRSLEHEVSLLSLTGLMGNIDSSVFDPLYFGITKEGKWLDSKRSEQMLREGIGCNQTEEVLSAQVLTELLSCDLVFPLLHGPYGEDGKLQGLLETLKLPSISCSTKPSAICMDKAVLKKIALFHEIPVIPFVDFSLGNWRHNRESLLVKVQNQLTFPLFVKPVHLGSSIGVTKVHTFVELESAIENIFKLDGHILIENGIVAREIEFAVFGCDDIFVSNPGEILASGQCYDYEKKYGNDAIKTAPQADLPKDLVEIGRQLAYQAYTAACCDGLARVDFFLDQHGNYFLNEINPMPGFTSNSLYPKMCDSSGISYPELLKTLASISLHNMRKSAKAS